MLMLRALIRTILFVGFEQTPVRTFAEFQDYFTIHKKNLLDSLTHKLCKRTRFFNTGELHCEITTQFKANRRSISIT